jgi:3-hydroxyisobutyrate dehydrogenase-like beta-hydroxyacid dehydrogenase
MAKVAVLGLGLMGSAIAQNLRSRGNEVHGYNRTQEKTRKLAEAGVRIHSTPREAAARDVDVVITMLTDQDAVHEVALGRDGFLQSMKNGSVWIDMSTILPEASVEQATECESKGIERLDAPVMGGPQQAGRGELVLLVGGREEVFSKHLDFLRQLGNEVIYMGPHGAGHKMKLTFNLYLAIQSAGFSEALTLAQRMGIRANDFVSVINKTPHRSHYTEIKGPRVSKNDFTPSFTLKMMRKDLALVQDEATVKRISLPISSEVMALYNAAMNQGLSELDYSSIAVVLQKMNGVSSGI